MYLPPTLTLYLPRTLTLYLPRTLPLYLPPTLPLYLSHTPHPHYLWSLQLCHISPLMSISNVYIHISTLEIMEGKDIVLSTSWAWH